MALLAATAVVALMAAVLALASTESGFALLFLVVAALAASAFLEHRYVVGSVQTLAAETAALRDNRAASETAGFSRAHFIADMGHDLRQPLHALGLFLDALERRVTPGDGEKILSQTREAANALGRAFNALIDLVRVEADALVPELERFAIDDFLIRLSEESGEIAANAVDLRLVHAHCDVVSDARITSYIARILLTNLIDLGPSRIVLGVRRRGGKLHIELHCAKPGAVARKWDTLRSEPHTIPGKNLKALELDLFVARRLAELLGVALTVTTNAEHGVILSLALPLAPDDDALPLRGRSILLVSARGNHGTVREVALARAGAVVHVAGNARQADYAARIGKIDLLVTELPIEDVAVRAHIERGTRMLADRAPVESLVAAACAALEPKA